MSRSRSGSKPSHTSPAFLNATRGNHRAPGVNPVAYRPDSPLAARDSLSNYVTIEPAAGGASKLTRPDVSIVDRSSAKGPPLRFNLKPSIVDQSFYRLTKTPATRRCSS